MAKKKFNQDEAANPEGEKRTDEKTNPNSENATSNPDDVNPEEQQDRSNSVNPKSPGLTTGETVILNGDKKVEITKMGTRRYTAPAALIVDRYRSHFDEWINVPVNTLIPTFLFTFKRYLERNALQNLRVNDSILSSIIAHLLHYRTVLGTNVRKQWKDIQGNEVPVQWFIDQFDETGNVRPGASTQRQVKVEKAEEMVLGARAQIIYDLRKAMVPDDMIREIVDLLIENMDRYLVRGVLTQSVVRKSMEDEMLKEFETNSKLLQVDPDEILGSIAQLQEFYSMVCVTESVDAFGQECADLAQTDPNLRFVYTIRRLLSETRSPFVAVRFGSMRYSFENSQNLDPVVIKKPVIGDLVYKVTKVTDEFNDIRRRDIFAFLMYCYAKFVGDESADKITTPINLGDQIKLALDWEQQANRSFLGFPDEWYSARFFSTVGYDKDDPQSQAARIKSPAVSNLFKRIYLDILLSKIMQPVTTGLFSSRVKALIDERTLNRNEMWNFVINRSLDAGAIILDAFSETLAYMRSIASDLTIYFIDDDDRYTGDLVNFINQNIDKLSTPTLPMNHPASIHELSIILQQPSTYESPAMPGLTLSDETFRTLKGSVYDPVEDKFRYFYMNKIIRGSLLDCPVKINKNLIANSLFTPLIPKYTFNYPIESELANTPAGALILRMLDTKELLTSGYYYFIRDKVEFKTYTSARDLSDTLAIPYSIAEQIIERSLRTGNLYVVAYYTGTLNQSVVFDQETLPIWEFGPMPAESDYLLNQFITRWPFFAQSEHSGYLLPAATLLGESKSIDFLSHAHVTRRNKAMMSAYGASLDNIDAFCSDYNETYSPMSTGDVVSDKGVNYEENPSIIEDLEDGSSKPEKKKKSGRKSKSNK